MNLIDAHESTLVLVDYQQRLMPAIHRGAEAIVEAVRLADIARELGIRVIGTEQNPGGLGPNEPAIRECCESTLAKMHFDACADGLVDLLRGERDAAPREVVLAGCEAHVCLMQTGLGLLAAGFVVWVAAPACGSRTADNHQLAMQRLRDAGAGILSTEMVAFEWLRTCRHPRFRQVLQRLKSVPDARPR